MFLLLLPFFFHIKAISFTEEGILQAYTLQVSDPILEENLRAVCKECIVHDLGLGLYSQKEFSSQADLLFFLQEKTSTLRGIFYRESSSSKEFISCRKALEKMAPLIRKEGEVLSKKLDPKTSKLLGEKSTQELICQRLVIDALSAKEGSTKTLSPILMSLRNFVEALLFFAFPIVLLLGLLSFGLRPIISWVKLVLWVSVFPIFYVVVDLFLDSLWSFRTKALFGTSSPLLTLESAEKLSSLYKTLDLSCVCALAVIPLLLWLLMKGIATNSSSKAVQASVVARSTHTEDERPSSLPTSDPMAMKQDHFRTKD